MLTLFRGDTPSVLCVFVWWLVEVLKLYGTGPLKILQVLLDLRHKILEQFCLATNQVKMVNIDSFVIKLKLLLLIDCTW